MLDGVRRSIAHRIDRWFCPVDDDATSDLDFLAAEMLWGDPRVLPRSSA